MSKAFAHTSGDPNAKIVFVGEAFGQEEERHGLPFVGSSGKEFFTMLGEAWPEVQPELHSMIARSMWKSESFWLSMREEWFEKAGVLLTNVLALRPRDNKMENVCGKKAEVGGESYPYPPLAPGKYLRPDYLPELTRLHDELSHSPRNLVVALGNTACWALLRVTKIGQIRGATAESTMVPGLKVLPTYHPAGVLRNYAWRPIVLVDLMKARREAMFPEIRRPARQILINPTIDEVENWCAETLGNPPSILATDVETAARTITMVGFARSRSEAIVIPFADMSNKLDGCYWQSCDLEIRARQAVQSLLESNVPKLTQNGIYDIQYFLREGYKLRNFAEDTMLLHHALHPELNKGLGFLGSVYTNEASWKLLRHQETTKRDE